MAAETIEKQRRDIRTTALALAVETVQNVKNFTNYQVVHTAAVYEKYIWDAEVPTLGTAPVEGEVVPLGSQPFADGFIEDEPVVADGDV